DAEYQWNGECGKQQVIGAEITVRCKHGCCGKQEQAQGDGRAQETASAPGTHKVILVAGTDQEWRAVVLFQRQAVGLFPVQSGESEAIDVDQGFQQSHGEASVAANFRMMFWVLNGRSFRVNTDPAVVILKPERHPL